MWACLNNIHKLHSNFFFKMNVCILNLVFIVFHRMTDPDHPGQKEPRATEDLKEHL